jgi:sarcosine oxidase
MVRQATWPYVPAFARNPRVVEGGAIKIYDVAVVGKGLMGAAAARHLARPGARIVLIGPDEPAEPRTRRGVFASHYDSGRITRTMDDDPDWALLARRSIARYADIKAESGMRFYAEVGCIVAVPDASEAIMRLLATCKQVGAAAHLLDAAALRSAFPALRFPNGFSVFMRRGVLERSTRVRWSRRKRGSRNYRAQR